MSSELWFRFVRLESATCHYSKAPLSTAGGSPKGLVRHLWLYCATMSLCRLVNAASASAASTISSPNEVSEPPSGVVVSSSCCSFGVACYIFSRGRSKQITTSISQSVSSTSFSSSPYRVLCHCVFTFSADCVFVYKTLTSLKLCKPSQTACSLKVH